MREVKEINGDLYKYKWGKVLVCFFFYEGGWMFNKWRILRERMKEREKNNIVKEGLFGLFGL